MERQLLDILRQLVDLEQKMTVDHIIGLLPAWFLQRFQRPQGGGVEQHWVKPMTLEEMAEEFALSQRCGALIHEIFKSRTRMAYTKNIVSLQPYSENVDKFNEDESMVIRELEYWLHDFLDTYDKISPKRLNPVEFSTR